MSSTNESVAIIVAVISLLSSIMVATTSPLERKFPVLDRAGAAQNISLPPSRAESRQSRPSEEEQRSSKGLRTFVLRAAAEEGTLDVQRMRDQLAQLDRGDPAERYLERGFLERRIRAELITERRAIQLRALRDALPIIS